MCVNGRFIRNRYINKSFFVKCGHCPSCLQEKANRRMMRIYDEYSPKYLAFFVTLTYKRDACPYFRVEDYKNKLNPLPLYRDCRIQRTFGDSKVVNEVEHITDVLVDYSSVWNQKPLYKLKTLAYRSHQIGVCYYPDLQKFHKRLKINLKRKYNYHGYFKAYNCSEYGENSLRPHFHLLIFTENTREMYAILRSAVIASWPLCREDRWSKGFQLADDVTSYVSSYVNQPSDFPPFLQDNFRPKHSFSPHLGFNCNSYSLASLLSAIKSGHMQYSREINQNGVRSVVNLPLPKYVVNRYFPLFKGFSRFTDNEIYNLLQYPRFLRSFGQDIDYTEDDYAKIAKRISNAHYKFFPDLTDGDYALLFCKAWRSYRSTCYRLFMEDIKIPILQKYDNLFELDNGAVCSDLCFLYDKIEYPVLDPNYFSINLSKTQYNTQMFAKKVKNKKVNELLTNQVYVT